MFRSILFVLLACFLLPSLVLANEITIRPFLIDNVMVPRESKEEYIRLQNDYEFRKAVIFATVNEITVGSDGEIRQFVSPVMTDRTTNVTSWIEIGRGRIEVPAGEAVEVPLTIRTHPYAEPGEYHVFVGFVEATNRTVAEQTALAGDANGVIVKVTIGDERVDSMRVTSLEVDRFVTNTDSQQVLVTVQNPGELPSAPSGELIFYNNRGIEIAVTPVNERGVQIAPGGAETFAVTVPFENDLGRFKANLNLRYGANQQANLFDSTSFFMIPLWYLIAFGVAVLGLLVIFSIIFRRTMQTNQAAEHGDEITMFVRDGHDPKPQDHDIDLSEKN
jgi:hypothetical protein